MKRGALSGLTLGPTFLVVLACNGQVRFEEGDASATATRCAVDGDCKLSSLHCDAISGECVACTSDDQCARPDARRCEPASHRCVGCIVGTDCAPDHACEPTTRRCLLQCPPAPGPTCPPGAPWCDASRSICLRCRSDADCVGSDDGSTCDPADGRCVTCVDDTQCSKDAPRCERTHGRCVRCVGSADCAPAEVCDPVALTCL